MTTAATMQPTGPLGTCRNTAGVATSVESVHIASLAQVDVAPRFARIPESDAPIISVPLLGTWIHAPTAALVHPAKWPCEAGPHESVTTTHRHSRGGEASTEGATIVLAFQSAVWALGPRECQP